MNRLLVCVLLSLLIFGCRSADTSRSLERSPGGSVNVFAPEADASSYPGLDAGAAPGVDASAPAARVAFTAPLAGASFLQNRLVGGEWAAEVMFSVESAGVTRVELFADGSLSLGEPIGGSLSHIFFTAGEHRISAVGFDRAGAEAARDELPITIVAPADTGCHAAHDALGIDYTATSATRGIADPVRVQPVINGVSFRYVSNSEPTAMLMDCELAIRLHQLTELIRPYGIDEVIHIGIYNYRCIGGGDPDSGTCTPSQHAYARAIDIHAFGVQGSDDTYNTEDDWVITARGDACPISSSSEKDRILKEIACGMWSDGIFQIILTPNYNAGHRNHFHVDLTDGAMYIGVTAAGVDPAVAGLGH